MQQKNRTGAHTKQYKQSHDTEQTLANPFLTHPGLDAHVRKSARHMNNCATVDTNSKELCPRERNSSPKNRCVVIHITKDCRVWVSTGGGVRACV